VELLAESLDPGFDGEPGVVGEAQKQQRDAAVGCLRQRTTVRPVKNSPRRVGSGSPTVISATPRRHSWSTATPPIREAQTFHSVTSFRVGAPQRQLLPQHPPEHHFVDRHRRYQYSSPGSPRGSNCASAGAPGRAIGFGAETRATPAPALSSPQTVAGARPAHRAPRARKSNVLPGSGVSASGRPRACLTPPIIRSMSREIATARWRSTSRCGLRSGESGRMPDRGRQGYSYGLRVAQNVAARFGRGAPAYGLRLGVGPAGLRAGPGSSLARARSMAALIPMGRTANTPWRRWDSAPRSDGARFR